MAQWPIEYNYVGNNFYRSAYRSKIRLLITIHEIDRKPANNLFVRWKMESYSSSSATTQTVVILLKENQLSSLRSYYLIISSEAHWLINTLENNHGTPKCLQRLCQHLCYNNSSECLISDCSQTWHNLLLIWRRTLTRPQVLFKWLANSKHTKNYRQRKIYCKIVEIRDKLELQKNYSNIFIAITLNCLGTYPFVSREKWLIQYQARVDAFAYNIHVPTYKFIRHIPKRNPNRQTSCGRICGVVIPSRGSILL